MIAFGHTAVGTIVGVSAYQILGTGDLLSGLIITGTAGVASHYLTDVIPHGHFIRNIRKDNILPIIFFDLLLSLVLFTTLAFYKNGFAPEFWYILFGIGGAQLPDVLDGLIYIKVLPAKGIIKYEFYFHQLLHWHGNGQKTLILGLRDIWQLLVVLFAVVFLLKI